MRGEAHAQAVDEARGGSDGGGAGAELACRAAEGERVERRQNEGRAIRVSEHEQLYYQRCGGWEGGVGGYKIHADGSETIACTCVGAPIRGAAGAVGAVPAKVHGRAREEQGVERVALHPQVRRGEHAAVSLYA